MVQEAVSSSNSELVKLRIKYRDYQRNAARKNGIPDLLNKLKQAPDYMLKWNGNLPVGYHWFQKLVQVIFTKFTKVVVMFELIQLLLDSMVSKYLTKEFKLHI